MNNFNQQQQQNLSQQQVQQMKNQQQAAAYQLSMQQQQLTQQQMVAAQRMAPGAQGIAYQQQMGAPNAQQSLGQQQAGQVHQQQAQQQYAVQGHPQQLQQQQQVQLSNSNLQQMPGHQMLGQGMPQQLPGGNAPGANQVNYAAMQQHHQQALNQHQLAAQQQNSGQQAQASDARLVQDQGDSDPNMYGPGGAGQIPPRSYRKKKAWPLYLNITIETPDLDNKLNESFTIEIGSNQRLKILQLVILSQVKNPKLRELIQKEQMYIYIEGKEPVARKSKSLAEMGVKNNDNLIVTTEMRLPVTVYSSDDTNNDGNQLLSGADGLDLAAELQQAGINLPGTHPQQPNSQQQAAPNQQTTANGGQQPQSAQQQNIVNQMLLQQQQAAQKQQPYKNLPLPPIQANGQQRSDTGQFANNQQQQANAQFSGPQGHSQQQANMMQQQQRSQANPGQFQPQGQNQQNMQQERATHQQQYQQHAQQQAFNQQQQQQRAMQVQQGVNPNQGQQQRQPGQMYDQNLAQQQQQNMQAVHASNGHVLTQQQQMMQRSGVPQQYGQMGNRPNANAAEHMRMQSMQAHGQHPNAPAGQAFMPGMQPGPGNMMNRAPGQAQGQMMQNQGKMDPGAHGMQPGAKRPPGPNIQARKATPTDRKARDPSAKSPTMRRPKEITYARLRMVQQYYKGNELKSEDDKEDVGAETAAPQLYNAETKGGDDAAKASGAPEETGEQDQDAEQKNKAEGEAGAQQDEEERKGIDESNQETAVDDRGEENHEEYNQSEHDHEDEQASILYDPTDVMQLDINSKSKARQLQKLILDKKNMKKANIILFKQVPGKDPAAAKLAAQQAAGPGQAPGARGPMPQVPLINNQMGPNAVGGQKQLVVPANQNASLQWVQFSKNDFEKTVKEFEGTLIGFKIYLELTTNVEGCGATFKQGLQVDPKDKFSHILKTKTMMWNTFMTRGQNKCIIMIQYKGKEEDAYLAPNTFDKTFEELGIHSGGQITLIEMKGGALTDDSDVEEGGEDDMEDMEAELEEGDPEQKAAEKDDQDADGDNAESKDPGNNEGGEAESFNPAEDFGSVAAMSVASEPQQQVSQQSAVHDSVALVVPSSQAEASALQSNRNAAQQLLM